MVDEARWLAAGARRDPASRRHRSAVAAIVLVLALVGLGACARGDDASVRADGGDSAAPSTEADVAPGTEFVGISDVVGTDGNSLLVMTDPVPPATATGACQTAIAPRVEETPYQVTVYVDTDGARAPFDGCDPAPRQVTLPLADPVGDRLVQDAFGSYWRNVDGEWTGCDHVVMTCITEPASCDNGTLRAVISNSDVPAHFGMRGTRCEPPYAVVDVDIGQGSCPVTGDAAPNPCAGQNFRRMFFAIEDEAWVLLAAEWHPGAGCGPTIAEVDPTFPTALCADLPALS